MRKLFVLMVFSIMSVTQTPFAIASEALKPQNVDPKGIVPRTALSRALTYYQKNIRHFDNRDYIGIIDYTQPESKKRFYIINLRNGQVSRYLVAHGQGSDPGNTGHPKIFSNRANSKASSLGFMRTAELYFGKKGKSLRLDGLSKTNNKARARSIVIHPAAYVAQGGRSHGCPAVEPSKIKEVVSKLRGGAMIYAYGGQSGM